MRTAGTTHAAEEALEGLALAAHRGDAGQGIEVALGVAQVPDRPDDLAVLDKERAVAGHARDDGELRVDRVRVVEPGHEQAAIQAADELVTRRRPGAT